MEISQAQNKAVGEYVDLVASKVGAGGRAVHPETAIASAARIAGSFSLRSFGLQIDSLQPGSVVLSEESNEKGPRFVAILATVLSKLGVTLDEAVITAEDAPRGAPPRQTTLETLILLQKDALGVASRNQLSLEEAALSATLATAFIVKECARDIQAEVAFNVAVRGFIEGSKTAPPPVNTPGT
ncbi:MAG: hypothetical protein KGL53_04440 [Elusimicrobia bacterium]|nr:hypothetical protein [Elusimicrobiota bacterium]